MQSAKWTRTRGFTLLELLVVMVIIGLLAGIVGPRLFGEVSKSEITAARAQIDALSKALDQFRLDVGRYPSSQEGLAALMQAPADADRWAGPYLKKAVPMDPWAQPYRYQFPGTRNPDFDLYSDGPDRQAGGEGRNADIGNW